MEVKVKFNDINVKEEKEKTLVKILMLKGEKGEKGDGDFNIIEDVKVNGTSLPVSDKSVNVPIPTDVSSFNNDSGYLVENDMAMTKTSDIQNGSQITDGTGYGRLNKILGDTSQVGTPTPDNPIDIGVVTGDITIQVSNANNTSSQTFELSLGDIELYNKDYIYEENGKWYISKKVRHLSLPISGMDNSETYPGWINQAQLKADWPGINTSNLYPLGFYFLSNIAIQPASGTSPVAINTNPNGSGTLVLNKNYFNLTQTQWKENYPNLVFELVYELTNAEVSEITDVDLIEQLEQIKNFLVYQNVTNFTISSDGLRPKLNITYGTTNYNIYSKEEVNDKIETVNKEIEKTNEKINENLKFHSVSGSSATYIVEFPNGKNLLVDTGYANQWTAIKNAIDGLGIKKFDYLVLTHFHPDHIGNVQNICNNYDLSECTCWVQMKPDYTNHSEEIEETEEFYDETIETFESYGLTPIVPTNDSYYIIDENTKLHFLNTDLTLAEDNDYYTTQAEWHSNGLCNFNMFSLVTEVIYKANVITLTGDLEKPTEQAIYTYLRKTNILTAPHHGVNREALLPFYEATKPDFTLLQYVPTAPGDGWLQPYFRSFKYIQKVNSEIVTPAWSDDDNGLFTFVLNGDSIKTNVVGLGVPDNKITRLGEINYKVHDYVDYNKNQTPATITLEQLIENMENSDILNMYWHSTETEYYPQLYQDIQTIYPGFGVDAWLYIEKTGGSNSALLRIIKGDIEIRARYFGQNGWLNAYGTGQIASLTTGTSALINILKNLPKGKYQCTYFQDTNDTVLGNPAYVLDINLISNDGTDITASIIATNRNTNPIRSIVACLCYINTAGDTQYDWKEISFEQPQEQVNE